MKEAYNRFLEALYLETWQELAKRVLHAVDLPGLVTIDRDGAGVRICVEVKEVEG